MFPDKHDMDFDPKVELNPAFWEMFKDECANVAEPPGLKSRLRSALAVEASRAGQSSAGAHGKAIAMVRPSGAFWKRYFLFGAIAALLFVSTALTGTLHGECPYILSCIEEHRRALNGNPLLKETNDPKMLGEFASAQIKASVLAPVLEQYMLKPIGAGKAEFASLKQFDAPDGVFVKYAGIGKESATVLIQPWAEEEPEPWNKTVFKGHTFWATSHQGKSVATWKSRDGKLLLSLVTDHSLNDTLNMAVSAGDQM